MKISETKIGKKIEKITFDYFPERGYLDSEYGFKADEIFEMQLKKMGWKLLDLGKYSAVFEHPKKNYVLKVNFVPDKGYAQYVNIIKHSRNPHFPKISDVKTLTVKSRNNKNHKDTTRSFSVYLIEKLYPLAKEERRTLSEALENIVDWPSHSLADIFNKIYGIAIPSILEEHPVLVKAARIIGKNKGIFYNDLHAGNIMKRKDGTIVITDPYSGGDY